MGSTGRPLHIRVENAETGTAKDFNVYGSPIHIGRSPENDVVLDVPFVSGRHALIRFDDRKIDYTDLGSSNGTLVDGRKVTPHVPIELSPETDVRILSLRLFCSRLVPSALVEQAAPAELARVDRAAEAPRRLPPTAVDNPSVDDVIAEALSPLEPLAEQHRAASAALLAEIRRIVTAQPPHARPVVLLKISQQLPALAGEAAFRQLADEHGASLPYGDGVVTRLIGEFAETLVPGTLLCTPRDIERLLQRVATSLETSMRAFVQLRLGHEHFRADMGVPAETKATPLHRATDAKAVLSFLLDLNGDVTERIRMLTSAYADLMAHQVALLSGTMEGVRNLLALLSPVEIEARVQRSGSGFARVVRPLQQLWRAFTERHRELSEEERELSAAVFGERFARAYLEAFSGHSDDFATEHS